MIEDSHMKKSQVRKVQDFETYAMWKSLPSFLRGQPRQVLEKFGIDDDIILDLLEVKNQKQFAERFGIGDPATLTDWNKRLQREGGIARIHEWARKLTPNVIFALYRNVSKHGDAAEVKTWFEVVEGM